MKGHVPRENLEEYRALGRKRVALLGTLSDEYRAKAKQAPMELLEEIEALRKQMLELRVELK